MDHGKLTDHNGKSVDFRNIILIMTTNAGASDLARPPMGFNRTKREGDDMEAVNRMFTPEFRNRLDAMISFAPLSREIILRVVEKFLMQLEEQLHEKKVEASFTSSLKDYLAKHGFDPLMGARPMARLIQDTIRRALADELLFGRLLNGGKVTVDCDPDGKIKLEFSESDRAPEPEEEDVTS
jgi:ATP-dependent Clp protease ATP-binding subunit ClpA